MTGITSLGRGPEFDRIRSMIQSFGSSARFIGDDAAVVDIPAGSKLVVSTDTSVDGIHFRQDWLSLEEIGYRATAAALSDIAAMGASPVGVLLAVGIPESQADALEKIARGAGAAAADSKTVIIGGDLSLSPTLTVTASVLGSCLRPLLRSGARTGDKVYLTGTLGGAALGLAALLRGGTPSEAAREKFARPVPRIAEALWLAEQGAGACIDISDGIAGDLGHVAAASGVDLVVDVMKIPLFDGATLEMALSSGEEYELCVTSPIELNTAEFRDRFGLRLTLIGSVEPSGSPMVIFQSAGAPVSAPTSFSHFSK